MSEPFKALKGFLGKQFSEARFRKAGKGRRLNEDPQEIPSSSNSEPIQRAQFSQEAQKAGQAAMSRISYGDVEKKPAKVFPATKHLSLGDVPKCDEKFSKDVMKIKIEEETKESLPRFLCPCIGDEVLTREEWMPKIKHFLQELIKENPLNLHFIATLIKTVNDPQKANFACEKIKVCLQNIIDHPEEEKYRKIKSNNPLFRDKLLPIDGCEQYLLSSGFNYVTIDEIEFLIFQPSFDDINVLRTHIDILNTATQVELILDRNLRIIQGFTKPNLHETDEFFKLTTEEVRLEATKRHEEIEEMMILKPRSMKGNSSNVHNEAFEFVVIKIKFPDGMNLQGTFRVEERVQDVRQFVFDHLQTKSESFNLLTGLGRNILDPEKTLTEEKLIPSSLLHFEWRKEECAENKGFLRDDLITLS